MSDGCGPSPPPTVAGETSPRDLIADLRRLDRSIKDNELQMRDAADASRTTLTDLPGVGIVLAAKVLGHVGNIDRFPSEHHFASYTGSAPLEASSGNTTPHRLNTGGNRSINSVLHIIAVCQIQDPGVGRTTTGAKYPRERPPLKLVVHSNADSPTSSTAR